LGDFFGVGGDRLVGVEEFGAEPVEAVFAIGGDRFVDLLMDFDCEADFFLDFTRERGGEFFAGFDFAADETPPPGGSRELEAALDEEVAAVGILEDGDDAVFFGVGVHGREFRGEWTEVKGPRSKVKSRGWGKSRTLRAGFPHPAFASLTSALSPAGREGTAGGAALTQDA